MCLSTPAVTAFKHPLCYYWKWRTANNESTALSESSLKRRALYKTAKGRAHEKHSPIAGSYLRWCLQVQVQGIWLFVLIWHERSPLASVTTGTQTYKHADAGKREGANLSSTSVIHHMITSHPKHACVHKGPSALRLQGICWHLHYFVFHLLFLECTWSYLNQQQQKNASHDIIFKRWVWKYNRIKRKLKWQTNKGKWQGHQSASLKHTACRFTNATVSTRHLFSPGEDRRLLQRLRRS